MGYAGTDRRVGSRSAPTWLGRVGHCLVVIPREPALGIFEQLRGMSLKSRQVKERVNVVESASVNEAHEQIPDVSPVFGPKEQTILAMLYRPLKHLLTEVVVQGGSWNS